MNVKGKVVAVPVVETGPFECQAEELVLEIR
jgi:hypothetical protein